MLLISQRLKKDIADCVNEAHELMNEHKQAQEKLKKLVLTFHFIKTN